MSDEREARLLELAQEASADGCLGAIHGALYELSYMVSRCRSLGEASWVARELHAVANSARAIAADFEEAAKC